MTDCYYKIGYLKMFEMPPYWDCPSCESSNAFGVLSIYEDSYERRCHVCNHSQYYPLSNVDKKVIYVDQFVISNLFHHRNNPDQESPHRSFWKALDQQIQRLLLLQLAVFPYSNIHQDESLVSRNPDQYRDMYQKIGGGTSFINTEEIEERQIYDFANSWLLGNGIPEQSFDVDEILHGRRNQWLPLFRVEVNSDFSQFIEEIRTFRSSSSGQLSGLFRIWGQRKPSFQAVQKFEASSFGRTINLQRDELLKKCISEGDFSLNEIMSQANILNTTLFKMLKKHGIEESECMRKITNFFEWEGIEEIPSVRISSYLFAAIARKASNGQNRLPNAGMLNDIRIISNYLPYVDAMFLDKECASYLHEEPLKTDLNYGTQIFSLNNKDEFLSYLKTLEDNVDNETLKLVHDIYGDIPNN